MALNPRWVNYARVHGRTSDEQLAHDRVRWPGGSMCGFILWNNARLREFAQTASNAGFFLHGHLIEDGHVAYDAWLDSLPDQTVGRWPRDVRVPLREVPRR